MNTSLNKYVFMNFFRLHSHEHKIPVDVNVNVNVDPRRTKSVSPTRTGVPVLALE